MKLYSIKLNKLLFYLVLAVILGCNASNQSDFSRNAETPLNQVIINYLAVPGYINADFAAQTIGQEVRFEHADRVNEKLYFSMSLEEKDLSKICIDTTQIEYGKRINGISYLPPAQLKDSTRTIFRFPYDQLWIDSTVNVNCSLGKYTYSLSLFELRDLAKAHTLYNSPALCLWETESQQQASIANHSAPIAKPNEPSLMRLLPQIVADSVSQEVHAQALLDFVSEEITYQFHGAYEIFMKPHEVLLSGRSDCSGKVVLYASLLEQVEIPYLLVYLDNHICVAVAGDFPTQNDMFFEHEGKRYFIAETTVEHFQIGKTRLHEPITEDRFVFLQKPGYQTKLYDVARSDSLDFVMMEVEVEDSTN